MANSFYLDASALAKRYVPEKGYVQVNAIDCNAEIVHAKGIALVSVTKRLVTSSLPLIVAHSINSTDALILKSALAIARRLRAVADDLVLVASDHRLLRAAQAEGLSTFDPETQDQAALATLVGP